MKISVSLLLLLSVFSAQAALFGVMRTKGTIRDFDEKTVTLLDEEGNVFKVARSVLEPKYKIQSGVKVVVEEKTSDYLAKPIEKKAKP